MSKCLNFIKSSKYQFDICPADPTKIYEPLQIIEFEGACWFEVFLMENEFLNNLLNDWGCY
jgi:hypothetical protein